MEIIKTILTLVAAVICERLKPCSSSVVEDSKNRYEVIFTDLEQDVRKLKQLKIAVETLKKVRLVDDGNDFNTYRKRRDPLVDSVQTAKSMKGEKESFSNFLQHFVKGLQDFYPEAATRLYAELGSAMKGAHPNLENKMVDSNKMNKGDHTGHCYHCNACHHTCLPDEVYRLPEAQMVEKTSRPHEKTTERTECTCSKSMTTESFQTTHGSHHKKTTGTKNEDSGSTVHNGESKTTKDWNVATTKRAWYKKCARQKCTCGQRKKGRQHHHRRKHRRTTSQMDVT